MLEEDLPKLHGGVLSRDTRTSAMSSSSLHYPWRETPLIESHKLSMAAGCRVFLKLENHQPSASFKSRAVGNFIRSNLLEHPGNKDIHFYSTSGGNAGIATVMAAATYGYPCTVVVPMTTKENMIQHLYDAGATKVIQSGDSWMEANQWLLDNLLAKDPNGVYVPPFDHPAVFEGNATVISETCSQLKGVSPDVVVCSVGGGGLFTGIMQGMDQVGWDQAQVLAVETVGADSLSTSLKMQENTTLPAITSIATSLGARRVAQRAFEQALRPTVTSAVVSDAHAALACINFARDERILVEPACGASIAICYNGMLKKLMPSLTPESKVVLIVCGGAGISLELLEQYRQTYSEFALEMLGERGQNVAKRAFTANEH